MTTAMLLAHLANAVVLVVASSSAGDPQTDVFRKGFERMSEAAGWSPGRSARPDEKVELTFWVKETHLQKLKKIAEGVSDPDSREYGHYLTKEEADALTAPSTQHIAVVEEALRGYQIRKQNDGAVISANVPVAFAEQLLGGSFVYFCRSDEVGPDQECVLRNPTAKVPAALHSVCDIITPLDDPLAPRLPGPITEAPMPLSLGVQDSACCFSFGYGALMKPCCLTATPMSSRDDCKVGNRIGGSTGFHAGECPRTAEDAQDIIKMINYGISGGKVLMLGGAQPNDAVPAATQATDSLSTSRLIPLMACVGIVAVLATAVSTYLAGPRRRTRNPLLLPGAVE